MSRRKGSRRKQDIGYKEYDIENAEVKRP